MQTMIKRFLSPKEQLVKDRCFEYNKFKKEGAELVDNSRKERCYGRAGMVRIALYGLENKTDIDYDMPLRLFFYDGAAYRRQLLADKKNKEKVGKTAPRYPVVTLVLYFGYRKHWKTPRTLYECLTIPEEIKPYVNDYRMNLYEIAYLSDEQVQKFTSDFKIVADYFVQMRKNKDYTAPEATIKHVHELLQLMAVMTKDNRFEDVYSPDMEEGDINMCEVLDKIENRGIKKGIAQGMTQGIAQGMTQGIAQGEDNAFSLIKILIANNRLEDLKRVSEDESYRKKLMIELLP